MGRRKLVEVPSNEQHVNSILKECVGGFYKLSTINI